MTVAYERQYTSANSVIKILEREKKLMYEKVVNKIELLYNFYIIESLYAYDSKLNNNKNPPR